MKDSNDWQALAQRIAQGLAVQTGELVQVRDHADRPEVLFEVLLAVELAGATPLVDHQSPAYLERWLTTATPAAIQASGRHRLRCLEQVDRVVVLSGGIPDLARATPAALAAWQEMDAALTALEEERQLPILVVAAPTQRRAERIGMSLAALEAHVLPALLWDSTESQQQIQQTLATVSGNHIVIATGDHCQLHLYPGDRTWHGDDGVIDDLDRRQQTIVSNLPAGSVYTTVVEEQTHGSLYLPIMQDATDVVLHFAAGRIAEIEAGRGADVVAAWLDSHSGEPRRVSHIGIGLNPHLRQPIGWTIVDEHIAGALFLALGENRYMGGQNASALNHDFALVGASLQVDGRDVVAKGQLVIAQ